MSEPSARDFRDCHVLAVDTTGQGRHRVRVQLRHEDHDPACTWSWCDLDLELPQGSDPPRIGAVAELVLRSAVVEARESELEGIYSCKLQPASMPPSFGFEREREGFFSGLLERDEDEHGDVLFHMGSGLTCYLDLADLRMEGALELEHGEWYEFRFRDPHGVLSFQVSEELPAQASRSKSAQPATSNGVGGKGLLSRLLGRLGSSRGSPGSPDQ